MSKILFEKLNHAQCWVVSVFTVSDSYMFVTQTFQTLVTLARSTLFTLHQCENN